MEARQCPSCHAINILDSRYCASCGLTLPEDTLIFISESVLNGLSGSKNAEGSSREQDKSASLTQDISSDLYQMLKERIQELSNELKNTQGEVINLRSRLSTFERRYGNLSILSDGFLRRSFNIWWHTFIAQLIISGVIYLVIILGAVLIGYLSAA